MRNILDDLGVRIILIAIVLFVLFFSANAKPRTKIKACEIALNSCLSAKDMVSDTIFIYSGKEAKSVAKQVEKTKRKQAIEETKQNKSDNKKDVKTDWFLNLIQGMTRMTAILTASGFFAAGGIGYKLLHNLKEKVPFFKWLPI